MLRACHQVAHVCVAMFDRDRSGSIELHEFQALWTYIGQWRQVFDQYDRDRSGAIDGSELHNSKFLLRHVLCVP